MSIESEALIDLAFVRIALSLVLIIIMLSCIEHPHAHYIPYDIHVISNKLCVS